MRVNTSGDVTHLLRLEELAADVGDLVFESLAVVAQLLLVTTTQLLDRSSAKRQHLHPVRIALLLAFLTEL